MKAFVVGVQFDVVNLNQDDAMKTVMSDFDTSHDERIDFPEFVNGITKWLGEAKGSGEDSLDNFHLVCCTVLKFSKS